MLWSNEWKLQNLLQIYGTEYCTFIQFEVHVYQINDNIEGLYRYLGHTDRIICPSIMLIPVAVVHNTVIETFTSFHSYSQRYVMHGWLYNFSNRGIKEEGKVGLHLHHLDFARSCRCPI